MEQIIDDLKAKQALERAITVAGGEFGMKRGFSALGREIGVGRQTIWAMLNTAGKASPQYVIDIERATGISRHDLRPDIYPVE